MLITRSAGVLETRRSSCNPKPSDGSESLAFVAHRRLQGKTLFLFFFVKALFERENFKSLFDLKKFRRKAPRYARILLSLREQRKIVRLLKDSALSDIPRLQPAFPFKFLHERLLCRGISTKDRVRCLLVNYGFWRSTLTPQSLQGVVAGESCVIFERLENDSRVSITLCLSNPVYLEGEMSLLLKVDGERTHILSFTIIPGDIVGSDAERAILISRLQGVKSNGGCLSHRAAAALGVQPQKALLDALQGIALAIGISHLSGIRAKYQSFYADEHAGLFLKAYDQFYAENGMSATSDRLFAGTVPLSFGPIRTPNRRRARMRRATRMRIIESVQQSMAVRCGA